MTGRVLADEHKPVGGSVAQHITLSLKPGPSYSFSVWLRAVPAKSGLGYARVVGPCGIQENGPTAFTVGLASTFPRFSDGNNDGSASLTFRSHADIQPRWSIVGSAA
jgi:hypothetical protein